MPQYVYTCTKCNKTVTRLVKLSDRDGQTCDRPSSHNNTQLCSGELVREEVADTAKTPYSWKP